jgi:hypothetical protein
VLRALGVLAVLATASFSAAVAPAAPAGEPSCGRIHKGEHCGPGHGRRSKGGGNKASHRGWPAITGVLWMVTDHRDHAYTGTPLNDELLGFDGSDVIDGAGGRDVIWGDSHADPNPPTQHDVLRGGPARDFLYASHGHNIVEGGPGNDYVNAHFGRGRVDCGPGRDTVEVRRHHSRYKLVNCERVKH